MTSEIARLADRRAFLQRSAALGGLGLLGGCATTGSAALAGPGFRAPPPLAPIKARADRIMGITVCLRPFRAAGPRLEGETVGDKLVVHNYGHGGSGWSLSWGSGLLAVKMALAGGEKDIAVIGGGALGLTAATIAQRAGARVTIYAKDRLPEARSARATGIWSPDSRIALAGSVGVGFPAYWEEMARKSFRIHQQYLGLADRPVEWIDRYALLDTPNRARAPEPMEFAHYESRIRDLTPPSEALEAGQHPFPVPYVRKASLPMFNIAAYGHVLTNDFLLNGGRFEMAEFRTPADLGVLKQKVVINCTGYGARALWKDESIVPVRGQIAWLIPQEEVTYSLYYRGIGTTPRRDGMAVQNSGPDESYGYNDDNEAPDRAEAEAAVATIAPLFQPRA
ncbi:FAD-dependent oxidoreductase [Phenylobacterium sp.]|uniref:FAD-dependent oxidoreductase n=1 Tax=Phenylobacterium sp. TaxID=1871053 RepID=UPI0025CFC401|nr:FAD-dependent oxidoreductase [Phenylobacterium sp.]